MFVVRPLEREQGQAEVFDGLEAPYPQQILLQRADKAGFCVEALDDALTAQRLFDEVRAAGSPGSYTQVKASVRQVRPRPPVAPVVRFETPPGYQGQVDFGTFTLP